MHWCLSCLHGLALRSPGSWLGGSRVSALRLFCLAPLGSSDDVFWLCPFVASMDDLLGTRHTSCLVITLFTTSLRMLSFHCFLLHHTAWHHEDEAATVPASLAVISTASKHLHNDLARAIEALEQKKEKVAPLHPAKFGNVRESVSIC